MPDPPPEVSYEITSADDLFSSARALIYDFDEEAKEVDDKVLQAALRVALPEFSMYVPLRLFMAEPITIEVNNQTATLPARFMGFDRESFLEAIGACGNPWRDFSNYSDSLIFSSLTQAAMPRGGSILVPPVRKQFDQIQDGNGGHLLYINPALGSPISFKCLYYAVHSVAADNFSIPVEMRGALVYKLAEAACRALARRLWMDQQARLSYGKLAEQFKEDFDRLVVNVPIGFFG